MKELIAAAGRQTEAVRNRELLGRNVDFQQQYTRVLMKYGEDVVHKRDPKEPRDILCMDEGLEPKSNITVRLAGPVPLLARTLPLLQQNAAEGVVYGKVFDHEKCGALGLNLAALGDETDINHDKAGAVIARRFAKELSGEYLDYQVEYGGRLPLTRRPKDRHTGQIVYYDARVSGLDLAHLEPDFDPGYTISRGLFGQDASREYANLAVGIAFGNSGLAGDLTPGTPLHLVGIADEQSETATLADELGSIRRSRGQDAERIQVHVIAA